jgi:hypothetical protein
MNDRFQVWGLQVRQITKGGSWNEATFAEWSRSDGLAPISLKKSSGRAAFWMVTG